MFYEKILATFLRNSEAIITKREPWLSVAWPAASSTPSTGWKLHMSATPRNAPLVLALALPILRQFEVPFKICDSSESLGKLSGRLGSQSQTGKFITIYPPMATAQEIAGNLVTATKGLMGPHIPTDRQIVPDSPVYYRFGAFRNKTQVNAYGEVDHVLEWNGNIYLDKRLPTYQEPPCPVSDPFKEFQVEQAQKIGTVYTPIKAFRQAPKGGVYLIRNAHEDVFILKEARARTGAGVSYDARTRLSLEYIVMMMLSEVEGIPKVYDFFLQDGNAYLVEEYVQGRSLDEIMRDDNSGKSLDLAPIESQLRAILKRVHEHGIVHHDLSLSNVLLTTPGGKLHPIDFELAQHLEGEWGETFEGTPGFAAPWRRESGYCGHTRDDWYSANQILLALNNNLMPSSHIPDRHRKILETGAWPPITDLIDLATAWLDNGSRGKLSPKPMPGATWNFHNGRAGIVAVTALHRLSSPTPVSIPDEVICTMMKEYQDTINYAHGLHFGTSGVALSLALAAAAWRRDDWQLEANRLWIESTTRHLRNPLHSDWTHGTAGMMYTGLILDHFQVSRAHRVRVNELFDLLCEQGNWAAGNRWWPSELGKTVEHYTGFAHGLAGIGYAILAYYRVFGDPRARNLLEEIWCTFNATERTGRWSRSLEDETTWYAWCHGTPGIIHFLVEVGDILPEAMAMAIEASETMHHHRRHSPHCLCHGSLSVAAAYEHLFYATEDSSFYELACDSLWSAILSQDSFRQSGPKWYDDSGSFDNPSFMTGGTGLASQILTLSGLSQDPRRLADRFNSPTIVAATVPVG